MNEYRLITTRIDDGKYRHELIQVSDDIKINIGDLSERFRDLIDKISRNSTRALEILPDRNKLESFLSVREELK